MKSLANEKTMTVKELANVFGVNRDTINSTVLKLNGVLRPLIKNSQGGYMFDSRQATEIKMELQKHHNLPAQKNLSNISTKIERNEAILKAMQYLIDDKETLQKQVENQALQLTVQAPKIEVYNQFIDNTGLHSIGEVANTLSIGRNTLFKKLRELNVFQKSNRPYQYFIDKKYFEVKEFTNNNVVKAQTYATPKGMEYIKNKLEVTE